LGSRGGTGSQSIQPATAWKSCAAGCPCNRRVLLQTLCPLSPCYCRLPHWPATWFSASHHGSGFLVVAKLCTELPFDFLIGHGESWLSGLYEAALSFSRAERAKAAIWP